MAGCGFLTKDSNHPVMTQLTPPRAPLGTDVVPAHVHQVWIAAWRVVQGGSTHSWLWGR